MPREKPRNNRAEPAQQGIAAPRNLPRERQEQTAASTLAAEIERLRDQLKRSEARIEALEKSAHEDALTGLLNRRGFERAFARAIAYLKRYGGSAALLYLDLDGFKPVNDRYGHAAGDVILQEISRLILGSIRASDIAARLGGDELALVLWNLDEPKMIAKARALEDFVSGTTFEIGGDVVSVGISAGGIMLLAEDTLGSALQRADAAMYARKRERRG